MAWLALPVRGFVIVPLLEIMGLRIVLRYTTTDYSAVILGKDAPYCLSSPSCARTVIVRSTISSAYPPSVVSVLRSRRERLKSTTITGAARWYRNICHKVVWRTVDTPQATIHLKMALKNGLLSDRPPGASTGRDNGKHSLPLLSGGSWGTRG